MPEFITHNPYSRYKVIKVVFQTTLRAKCVVARRGTAEKQTYVMVIAPLKDKQGNPNGVKSAVSDLLEMDHPNLIFVQEAYEWERKCFFIMNDWATEAPSRRFGMTTLNERQVAEAMHKLASALLYMHKHNVVHGNLSFDDLHFKRSLGCDDSEADTLDVKIIDLGIGRHVDQNKYVALHQERLYGNPPEAKEGEFTEKSDVWTLGAAAFRLLTGDVKSEHLLQRYGFDLDRELERVSDLAKDFVLSCMKVIPKERMSLQEAFDHEWFRNIEFHQSVLLDSSILDALHGEDNRIELQRRACTFVAKHLRDKDGINEYKKVFMAIDVDGTGFITHNNFQNALQENPILPDVTSLFVNLDVDHSGQIAYNEFLAATLRFKEDVDELALVEAFHDIDVNGTGVISSSDLAGAISDINEDEAREMLYQALGHREDPDPKVEQHQFIALFRKQNHAQRHQKWIQSFVAPIL